MQFKELAAGGRDELDYQKLAFDYTRHPDQDVSHPVRRPVVVVGAGPVGLALAIDLAQREIPVVLLDNDNTLSTGSRAICFAKRTLEIFDRLGCGDRMVDKGVSWNVGKVFFKEEEVYSFDLLPETGYSRPAFVNLQQYYVEGYLAQRAAQLPLIDLRWKNNVTGVAQHDDHVVLTVETPDGSYELEADYVAACDGGRSAVRKLIGQESKGRTFRDRFLIADVKMKHEAPTERWFWFDPVFHPNQSVLLHRQPDDVWRIDFQLGWDADPEEEKKPENIIPRVKALLEHSTMKDAEFELEWASVYTFSCLRMEHFRHGRVIFAGDSAHGVSPFGARGANSGVQDAENLAWKLAAVVTKMAPDALLDTYADEREYAADENIRNSTRATDFITPKSDISRLFRDAVLELSKSQPFARTLVNSGRLSVPATFHGSALNTADAESFLGCMVPGAAAADAPIIRADGSNGWLLRELAQGFTILLAAGPAANSLTRRIQDLDLKGMSLKVLRIATGSGIGEADLTDADGLLTQRYDLRPDTAYLLRPDQHVCARWRQPSADQIHQALMRALAIN
ncbi:3-(3-hydroxy-phenyl)propionate hydroxylase [Variovorax paradoxus]|uniref:3-(3-hydroxy-phenyl)propionate hydroxylase n=1 Tax=Variovorax paradoxus TaxID=34073 RepID=A0AAW8EEJ9_VARPD|nr:FAD-dependent oxidoreductase [Variovorax paradoxus]MDP9971418.1 3-(3-hydroxy-phenyl)propionate hydroxylase [Variovorax paradoxus]